MCELRTMAADDLWLSPTQGEDVLCIAFTWQKHPEAVAALLPDLEARLAPFDGRPHWGKMSLARRRRDRGAVPAGGGRPCADRTSRPGPDVRIRVRRAGAAGLTRASRPTPRCPGTRFRTQHHAIAQFRVRNLVPQVRRDREARCRSAARVSAVG
ncbi:hypothetical protein JN350_16270 [Curtobacterium sp. 24E2]|nr:hypothetical protein JN350_16270 [Curtobacterium sp. 24E2]